MIKQLWCTLLCFQVFLICDAKILKDLPTKRSESSNQSDEGPDYVYTQEVVDENGNLLEEDTIIKGTKGRMIINEDVYDKKTRKRSSDMLIQGANKKELIYATEKDGKKEFKLIRDAKGNFLIDKNFAKRDGDGPGLLLRGPGSRFLFGRKRGGGGPGLLLRGPGSRFLFGRSEDKKKDDGPGLLLRGPGSRFLFGREILKKVPGLLLRGPKSRFLFGREEKDNKKLGPLGLLLRGPKSRFLIGKDLKIKTKKKDESDGEEVDLIVDGPDGNEYVIEGEEVETDRKDQKKKKDIK